MYIGAWYMKNGSIFSWSPFFPDQKLVVSFDVTILHTSGTLNWNLGLNITRHHHEIFAKGNPQKKDHFRVVNVSCQTGFWAPVRHQRLDTHRKSELQPTDSGFFEGRMRSWPRGGVFSQTSEAAMSWQTDAMPEQIWETIDICDRMISHIGWH